MQEHALEPDAFQRPVRILVAVLLVARHRMTGVGGMYPDLVGAAVSIRTSA